MNAKWISCAFVIGMLAAGLVLAGCDTSPGGTKVASGTPVTTMVVSKSDAPLYQGVLAAEDARANFRYRLQVLQGYYTRIGNGDKYAWASNELKNLNEAQWFRWEGLETVRAAPGENVANADETTLIEQSVSARATWLAAMNRVAELYDQRGQTFQAKTVRRAIERFDPVRTYTYILSAEIPPADLKPTTVVPEADTLYKRAYKAFREGKILPAVTDYDKERQALELFKELIAKYPNSNKIALSAYYIADIYKEYWNENVRAVHWYERAWQWDPNITEPARFQCATVYERMHDYPKAVECYRAALRSDPSRPGNFDYARKRIKELTGREE
jgi:tetratricopeptide (TPR) repeat protein